MAIALDDIRPLWQAIKRLHDETEWPETKQAVAVRVALFDLEQFCQATLILLKFGLTSPAMALERSVYERANHVLAASVDRKFAHSFVDADPRIRQKTRTGAADNVIRKIADRIGYDTKSITTAMRDIREFGSLHVHPSAGLPSFMLEEANSLGGVQETLDSLIDSLAKMMLLALYQSAMAVHSTSGMTTVVGHAFTTANTWSVEFGGFSVDDITGGDDSRIAYVDRN